MARSRARACGCRRHGSQVQITGPAGFRVTGPAGFRGSCCGRTCRLGRHDAESGHGGRESRRLHARSALCQRLGTCLLTRYADMRSGPAAGVTGEGLLSVRPCYTNCKHFCSFSSCVSPTRHSLSAADPAALHGTELASAHRADLRALLAAHLRAHLSFARFPRRLRPQASGLPDASELSRLWVQGTAPQS